MQNVNIRALVDALTLEEKAQLCGGKDFWYLHGIERLELPSIYVESKLARKNRSGAWARMSSAECFCAIGAGHQFKT